MALRTYANAPATTLSSGCTALDLTVAVASVTGFPITFPYIIILDRGTASEEVALVTNASGTTLTVTRGYDGTTAFSHSSGAEVVHGVAAIDAREANTHVNATGAVHGVTGSLVGTTDTQTLSNKNLTAASNTFPSTVVTTTGTQTLTNKNLTSTTNTFPTTLALDADLDAHTAATAAHGATGAVVGTTNTQTLTNKTLTSPTLNTPTITSPTVTGVGSTVYAYKSATEAFAGTTLQNDDHLFITLEVGTYIFETWLVWDADNNVPDISLAFTYSGTLSAVRYGIQAPEVGMTSVTSHLSRAATTAVIGSGINAGLTNAIGNGMIRGSIVTTATGTLRLQWAQDATSASSVRINEGSWLRATRIA